uniref:AAR2 N-terminal domain-containing protein n=1 Tax=Kalanchoe fedtschenkoi TaxID=63787 RepID=A0A7N0SZX7_KALFE
MLVEPKTEFEVTEQGATLLLLGVPQGTRIGIDAQVIVAGPDVKGVKCIPPGPHFVYNISAKRSGGDFSPEVGFFIYSITSDVIIRQWNQEGGLVSLSEDEVVCTHFTLLLENMFLKFQRNSPNRNYVCKKYLNNTQCYALFNLFMIQFCDCRRHDYKPEITKLFEITV